MFEFCPLWEATRPLLLALRDCSLPSVASDLRYWSDESHDEQAPDPWKVIPATLVNCLHFYSGEEQHIDDKLIKFRTQFARFCLERLKPNPKTGLPYEQDIHWRRGYVEAARKLCVNPDGRGHRVLHQVVEHESDPVLRTLAKRAYDVLRKRPELPEGLSPRRVVLQAFMELRRFESLGEPEREANRPFSLQPLSTTVPSHFWRFYDEFASCEGWARGGMANRARGWDGPASLGGSNKQVEPTQAKDPKRLGKTEAHGDETARDFVKDRREHQQNEAEANKNLSAILGRTKACNRYVARLAPVSDSVPDFDAKRPVLPPLVPPSCRHQTFVAHGMDEVRGSSPLASTSVTNPRAGLSSAADHMDGAVRRTVRRGRSRCS